MREGKEELTQVPVTNINGITFFVSGRLLKIGAIHDEYWLEPHQLVEPQKTIEHLKQNPNTIDIFTFSQSPLDTRPRHSYHMEWDNVAVLPITTFEYWWSKQINDKTRNMVRKAQKKGVEVRVVPFDDALVRGIADIYNETPVRQGRFFWHYGKDIEATRKENSTFLERSDFLGAFCNEELIGFIKLVYVGELAGMMQILSKIKDRDKAPNNALVAKAVQICVDKNIQYLTYAKYVYGKKGVDPMAEFKRHNGFQRVDIPKYFVPLSLKGLIGLKLRLHHDFDEFLPQSFIRYLRNVRARWYKKKLQK